MKPEHEARRKIIREWMSLPKDKRQTEEQAKPFAKKAMERIPSSDYRDGLAPCLTNPQETDITTFIQRRPQHPRRTGRDRSEQLVAIRRNGWSRSSECAV